MKHHSGFDLEGAALSELTLSASGLAEDVLAVIASNYDLGVAKDGINFITASAAHVHKVGVGSGG